MFKLKDIPDISKEFRKIYDKYFDFNGDPETTIPLVESFLEKYPYYPEAYYFLTVLFITDSQLPKAMKCIKALEKIDPWRLDGIFDKAEILILRDKNEEGLNVLIEGIGEYSSKISSGVDNFIFSAEPKKKELFTKKVYNALSEYFKNGKQDLSVFEDLKKELKDWQFDYLK